MERPDPLPGTQDDTFTERTAAWVIDFVVITLLSIPMFEIFRGQGILAYVLLAFVYKFVLEAMYGQTVGKRLLDVVVVNDDGTALTWTGSLIRNVLRAVDVLTVIPPYLVGFVAIFVSDEGQRIGDMVAGTMVTKVKPDEPDEPDEPDREPSGLVVDELRRRGDDTYLVLKNVTDAPIDLSNAAIDDAHGNRHPFPGSVTVGTTRVEMFHFGETKPFDPDPGTPLVLHRADGEYEIGWAESVT